MSTRNALDRQLSPAYAELLKDRAAETEKAQQEAEAAEAARIAADPVRQFEQTANQELEIIRDTVLNYKLTDATLAQYGTVKRAAYSEVKMRETMWEFKNNTPAFINTDANVAMLVEFVKRNELKTTFVGSWSLAHALLTHYNCYPDDVEQTTPATVEEEPVLSPSDRAAIEHQRYMTEVVGTDEVGRQWTDYAIDTELSAEAGLRLRRLFEFGMRGSAAYREYMRRRDIRAAQQAETNQIAAEEDREERL